MSSPLFIVKTPFIILRKRFRAFKRLMAGIPSDHELLARGMCIKDVGYLRFKYVLHESKSEEMVEMEFSILRFEDEPISSFLETQKAEGVNIDSEEGNVSTVWHIYGEMAAIGDRFARIQAFVTDAVRTARIPAVYMRACFHGLLEYHMQEDGMAVECLQEDESGSFEMDEVLEDAWFRLEPDQVFVEKDEYERVRQRALPRRSKWTDIVEAREELRSYAGALGIHRPVLIPMEVDDVLTVSYITERGSKLSAIHLVQQQGCWWVLEVTDWPDYVWRCASEEEACGIFVGLVEDEMDEAAWRKQA